MWHVPPHKPLQYSYVPPSLIGSKFAVNFLSSILDTLLVTTNAPSVTPENHVSPPTPPPHPLFLPLGKKEKNRLYPERETSGQVSYSRFR